MSNAGPIAFTASLAGPSVDVSNTNSLWSDRSGSLALLARAGDLAPGMADDVRFYSFGHPATNNSGSVAFYASVTDPNAGGLDTIYSNASGSLKLIASDPNLHFWRPVLNNAGHTLFRSGSGGYVWLERDGNAELLVYASPSDNVWESMPFLNDADQIALRLGLSLYATDRSGALQLIASAGDLLEVAPGDFRTIDSLDFGSYYPISEPRPNNSTAFNNLGQLVFWATFTDGTSGVFVSNAVADLPGDFNHDATVDAADYVVWRKTGGSPDDYTAWQTNFARTLFTGSGAGAIPSTFPLPPSTLERVLKFSFVDLRVVWT